jgi:hypothetical protein
VCCSVFPYCTVYDIALAQHYAKKCKSKSDNETVKCRKVMALIEKMILGKCRGGMRTVAEGALTFR